MTSHEPSADRDRVRAELAWVDEALAAGRVTAEDPAGRDVQRLALALRAGAPRPREAFAHRLHQWLSAEVAPADAELRVDQGSDGGRQVPRQRPRPEARQTRIRVVVADDHPLMRQAMIFALRR